MNGGLKEVYNMYKKTQYCCEWMDLFIKDPRVAIIYWPDYRMYVIPFLQKGKYIEHVTKGLPIDYCPWCATKLPKNLTDEWFTTLEKEYGLDDPDSKEQEKLVPEEFKTDEWWQKRNL